MFGFFRVCAKMASEEVLAFFQGDIDSSDGHSDCMDNDFLGNIEGEISDGPPSDVDIGGSNPGRVVSNDGLPGADELIYMDERAFACWINFLVVQNLTAAQSVCLCISSPRETHITS